MNRHNSEELKDDSRDHSLMVIEKVVRTKFPYLTITPIDDGLHVSHKIRHWYHGNPSWPNFKIFISANRMPRIEIIPFVRLPLLFIVGFSAMAIIKDVPDIMSFLGVLAISSIPAIDYGYRYHQMCSLLRGEDTIIERIGSFLGDQLEGKNNP